MTATPLTLAPWPIVNECYGRHKTEHSCPQCDGSHEHAWRTWFNAPREICAGPGVPVRCRHWGARKCDISDCMLRRHHVGEAHVPF